MSHLLQRIIELPFWLRAIFFIVVSAGLLFTGLRSQPIPQIFAQEDKVHHFIGFMVLSFSCRFAFLQVKPYWIALGCLLAGLSIEYAQIFFPQRTASLFDAVANACGVLTGLLIAWHYAQPKKIKEQTICTR